MAKNTHQTVKKSSMIEVLSYSFFRMHYIPLWNEIRFLGGQTFLEGTHSSETAKKAKDFIHLITDPIPKSDINFGKFDRQKEHEKLIKEAEDALRRALLGVGVGALSGMGPGGAWQIVKGAMGGWTSIEAIKQYDKEMQDIIARQIALDNTIDEVTIIGDPTGGVMWFGPELWIGPIIVGKPIKSGTSSNKNSSSSTTVSKTSSSSTSSSGSSTTTTTTTKDPNNAERPEKQDNGCQTFKNDGTTITMCPRDSDNRPGPDNKGEISKAARIAEVKKWAEKTGIAVNSADPISDFHSKGISRDIKKWADAVGLYLHSSDSQPINDEKPDNLSHARKWAEKVGLVVGNRDASDDWGYVGGRLGWGIHGVIKKG